MKLQLPLAAITALGLTPLSSVAQFESHPEEIGQSGDAFAKILVTFYSDPHFRGESFTLPAASFIEDLDDIYFGNGRRADNRVSSIWIEGNAHVTIYERDDFRGESITLTESEADLDLVRQGRYGDWDNDISSLTVTRPLEGLIHEHHPEGTGPYPEIGETETVVVEPPVHHIPPPPPPPVTVVVACPTGCTHGPGSGCSGGHHSGYGHGHGYGHGYRMDPAIVRKVERAYRDVLRRSPDREGRRTYYYTMIERGWSESRLRKELRKSEEYHQQTIPAVVTKVYREVLGRDPDPAGFQFYTNKMSRDGWYESHLVKALKRSPEYANRKRQPPPPRSYTPDRNAGSRTVSIPSPRGRTPGTFTPTSPTPDRSVSAKKPAPRPAPPVVKPKPISPKPKPKVVSPPRAKPVTVKIASHPRIPNADKPKVPPSPPKRERPAPPNLD